MTLPAAPSTRVSPPRTVPLRKRIRRELRVRALLALLAVASHVPHIVAVRLGGAAGWLAWHLSPRHRRAALDHLAIAFPDRDRKWRARVGQQSFANLGRSAVEVAIGERLDLARAVHFEKGSLEELTAAHAEGRGV